MQRVAGENPVAVLEVLLDPVSVGVLALYGALVGIEALTPGQPLPKIKGWIPRALGSFGIYFYLSSYLPMLWDSTLARYQLFNLESMNVVAAAILAVLIYELGVYVWHRTVHETTWLWRSFHQMHHSAERLESHSVHHSRGVHRYNYSDVPIFDIPFGTFRNPKDFAEATGFYDGASARIGDMLLCRDVSEDQARDLTVATAALDPTAEHVQAVERRG